MATRAKSEPVLRAAFVERATKAVEAWSRRLSPAELATAVAEPRDELVVLRAMQQPAAWATVAGDDPLAAARARGVEAENRLLDSEGGLLGVDEVASALHITRQAVDKRRRVGTLIAVPRGGNRWAYPAWQLDKRRTLPGLEEVLHALGERGPLSKIVFFLTSDAFLGGRTPLAALRAGDLGAVLRATEGYGEQVAR